MNMRPIKEKYRKKKLGQCLIDAGFIDEETLSKALEEQKRTKKKLGQILTEMGGTDDVEIAKALSSQLNIPFIRLVGLKIPKDIVSLVPPELAENYLLIPVEQSGKTLQVAMINPLDYYAIDDLRFATQLQIEAAVAPAAELLESIRQHYPKVDLDTLFKGTSFESSLEVVEKESEETDEDSDVRDLIGLTERAPIITFVNAIIADAIKVNASDIHIEPRQNALVIRFRVDGIMREIMKADRHIHAAVIARIKVISKMDISIRRKPQDGRTSVRYDKKKFDLRISSIPTSYGEKITIRILDPLSAIHRLEDLGIVGNNIQTIQKSIAKPEGVVLLTGPTGSGKSTTIYACLNELNTPSVNIITVEDPVEFELPGINQVQIDPKAGITFASGLRSILRQDPDIIMVGEIRDKETASIAFHAGQTGHMVFSTLHTIDAPSSITRLVDMGIEPFIISASLVCIAGQRLARRICPSCKTKDAMTPQIIERFCSMIDIDDDASFWRGEGCEACQFTGYSGRLGMYEVLGMSPALKELVATRQSAIALKKAAEKEGFKELAFDGLNKALDGLTTIEEVLRVAPPEESFPPQIDGVESDINDVESFLIDDGVDITEKKKHNISVSTVTPKKILVVDDNPLLLRVLSHLLESENFRVITALDGPEALKIIHKEMPDLIILDIIMPEMDGMEVMSKIKSNLNTRFIPVIILTSKTDIDDEVQGLEAGADYYLTKPVSSKKLLAWVKKLLDEFVD